MNSKIEIWRYNEDGQLETHQGDNLNYSQSRTSQIHDMEGNRYYGPRSINGSFYCFVPRLDDHEGWTIDVHNDDAFYLRIHGVRIVSAATTFTAVGMAESTYSFVATGIASGGTEQAGGRSATDEIAETSFEF